MKTKLLFGILLFSVLGLRAQNGIELEHEFDQKGFFGSMGLNPAGGLECYMFVDSFSFTVYNIDYSVSKKVVVTPPREGYMLSTMFYMHGDYFDKEEPLYLLFFEKIGSHYNDVDGEWMQLVDANGSIVKDFTPASDIYWNFYSDVPVRVVGDSYKMIVNMDMNGVGDRIEIYSLPGKPKKPSLTQAIPRSESEALRPRPNPARQSIALPYKLEKGKQSQLSIFNTEGKVVETKTVDGVRDFILLDISKYRPGVYVYTCEGVSQKFVVR